MSGLGDRVAEVAARLHGLTGFPVIDADRLRLRAPHADDVEPLFGLFSDPQVMRYWSRPAMREPIEARRYIEEIHEGFRTRRLLNWIIAEPGADRLLGTCTLYDLQLQHLRCGIGYALLPHWQRQGLASAAVQLAFQWATQWLGLHRVEADIHPDNQASRRLLERCGFRREGLLRQRFVTVCEIQDSEIYARLATE
jgi:RimJ/RimL family protein N-acetyltransferase